MDIILIAYAIVAITILVGGLFLMASAARTIPEDRPWHPMVDGGPESKELKQYMRKVTKRVHPEMVDVEPGTELMGVNFTEPKTECDLEEYKDLQARIDALRLELSSDEDEEDEDDGGGDVIISRV